MSGWFASVWSSYVTHVGGGICHTHSTWLFFISCPLSLLLLYPLDFHHCMPFWSLMHNFYRAIVSNSVKHCMIYYLWGRWSAQCIRRRMRQSQGWGESSEYIVFLLMLEIRKKFCGWNEEVRRHVFFSLLSPFLFLHQAKVRAHTHTLYMCRSI